MGPGRFRFACPSCWADYAAGPAALGRPFTCPRCGVRFAVRSGFGLPPASGGPPVGPAPADPDPAGDADAAYDGRDF